MHDMKIAVISTLVAGLTFSGAMLAANESSDKVENPKAAVERGPTDKNYDSVRQEHVDAKGGGAAGPTGDKPMPPKIRDWKAIDKNNDNLIQPDEMQAYLDKYGGYQVAEATK